MKNIKVLPDKIINLVAAGEVIERPCSVVKELIENSIDAHSTKIDVEIKNGGKRLIYIKDNGDGISRNDIRTAFLRHATSKISNESDLEKIITLGFRGEALSSICSVSKVEILTSFKNEETGTKYKIEGGKEISISDFASFKGTSISVKDLFYNTPARIKFLKKDSSEGNLISSTVDHLSLSHPEVSFKFVKDNKLIFQTPGDGKVSSVISRIFSSDFFHSLLKIEYSWNNVNVNGFISDPVISHSSSKIQNFFINGRWVKNKIISNAIEFALKDEYQNNKVSSIVYLSVPAEAIDVNVHPNKTEVRFENEKIIFDVIYNAVKNCIKNKKDKEFSIIRKNISPMDNVNKHDINNIYEDKKIPSISQRTMNVFNDLKKKSIVNDVVVIPKISNNNSCINSSVDVANNIGDKNVKTEKKYIENTHIDNYLEDEIKIIGEIFECFIIFQYKNEIFVVDKHAAHERLIFERLNKSDYKKNTQMLISSIVVDLSKEEYDYLIKNIDLVNDLGYALEDFGYGKILVRGVPSYISHNYIKESLFEISNFFIKNKSKSDLNELRKFYSKIACKSSIKSGLVSSYKEMEFLIKELIKSKISTCPHGRPVYFKVTKDEMYKKFLRK